TDVPSEIQQTRKRKRPRRRRRRRGRVGLVALLLSDRLLPAVRPEADAAPELVVVLDVVELVEERHAALADQLPLAVLVEVEAALQQQPDARRVLADVPEAHAAAEEALVQDLVYGGVA